MKTLLFSCLLVGTVLASTAYLRSVGISAIRFDGNYATMNGEHHVVPYAYNGMLFSGCTFNSVAISAIDPQPNVGTTSTGDPIVLTNDFSIQNSTFQGFRKVTTISGLPNPTVDIQREDLTGINDVSGQPLPGITTYGTINIGGVTGNTFNETNNIVASSGSGNLITDDIATSLSQTINGVSYGINQNFFRAGGTLPIAVGSTSNSLCPNLSWSAVNTVDQSWDAISKDGITVSCNDEYGESTIQKKFQHAQADSSFDSCDAWEQYAIQNDRSIQTGYLALDTMEHYIEVCAHTDSEYVNALELASGSQGWVNPIGTYSYQNFRAWVESIMYRDNSQKWFCNVFGDIGETYIEQTPSDYNDAVAMLDYTICCTPCTAKDSLDLSGYYIARTQMRKNEYSLYLDTVQDSLLTPFDTAEPTMQQLGLDTLVQLLAESGVAENVESILSNPSAYPNPTGSGTIISFSTSKESYVIINLFDILGHQASSAGFQSLTQPGNHEVPISLEGLPSGTYFARIETAYGEAQTVKVVKQ